MTNLIIIVLAALLGVALGRTIPGKPWIPWVIIVILAIVLLKVNGAW